MCLEPANTSLPSLTTGLLGCNKLWTARLQQIMNCSAATNYQLLGCNKVLLALFFFYFWSWSGQKSNWIDEIITAGIPAVQYWQGICWLSIHVEESLTCTLVSLSENIWSKYIGWMMPSYPSVTAPTVAGGKIRLGGGEHCCCNCCIPHLPVPPQKLRKVKKGWKKVEKSWEKKS